MKLFLIGYMGAGKTTVGKLLAEKLNCTFIDFDCFIENRYRQTIVQIFEEKGEAGFREIERRILTEICSYENVVVSTGGGLPCFYDNMELLNQTGITIYLKEDVEELIKRLSSNKQNRPLIKDKDPEELFDYVKTNLELREPFYNRAKIIFNAKKCSSKHDMNQSVEELICLIKL